MRVDILALRVKMWTFYFFKDITSAAKIWVSLVKD